MKKLTLTFDNGPSPEVTPAVLNVLADYKIQTTFFVCGQKIMGESQRALLRRVKQAGHKLGNHTFSHTIQFGTTNDLEAPMKEIGRTQEWLGDLAEPERLFRPYGGGGIIDRRLLSQNALDFLVKGQYTVVLWNSVPRDWEEIVNWPERALQDVRRLDWTLMVLHDLPTGAMQQLSRFLDLVQEEEVEIVQSFPSECVPIYRGQIMGNLDHIIGHAR